MLCCFQCKQHGRFFSRFSPFPFYPGTGTPQITNIFTFLLILAIIIVILSIGEIRTVQGHVQRRKTPKMEVLQNHRLHTICGRNGEMPNILMWQLQKRKKQKRRVHKLIIIIIFMKEIKKLPLSQIWCGKEQKCKNAHFYKISGFSSNRQNLLASFEGINQIQQSPNQNQPYIRPIIKTYPSYD